MHTSPSLLRACLGLLVGALSLPGCGDDASTPPADSGTPPADSGTPPADSGTPPVDAGAPAQLPSDPTMYRDWLGTDAFRTWRCDSAPQDPLPDSPHGRNVICVNPTLDAARSGSGDWPVGSAAVKIAYGAGGAEMARFLDVRRNGTSGAGGWYFLMRPGDGSMGMQGMGSEPMIQMMCANCHGTAPRDLVRRLP